MTEQHPRESLADLFLAVALVVENEGARLALAAPWGNPQAPVWRARAKRLRTVADALPDAKAMADIVEAVSLAAACFVGLSADTEIEVNGEKRSVTVESLRLRDAERLLRALTGEYKGE